MDVRIGLARLVSLACGMYFPLAVLQTTEVHFSDLVSQRVHALPDSAMEVVEKLTRDEANVVRSFVMHLKPRVSRGNIDENSAFSVSSPPEDITTNYMFSTTFSRPPERRESRTLDRGINALSLSDAMVKPFHCLPRMMTYHLSNFRHKLRDRGTRAGEPHYH